MSMLLSITIILDTITHNEVLIDSTQSYYLSIIKPMLLVFVLFCSAVKLNGSRSEIFFGLLHTVSILQCLHTNMFLN